MPQSALASLFQPFYQIDGSYSRRHGGAGLGLAISKRLAEGMGGDLEVDSTEGQGSCFSLRLDLAPALDETNEEPASAPQAGLSVLLLEDEEVNRQVLSGLLAQAGHRVTIAKTGMEAIQAVGRQEFDVVLADLRLPGMDGFEATRRMRNLMARRGKALPVIAVTANLMAEDIAACREAGMVAVVGKPVDPRRLQTALAEAMDASAQGLIALPAPDSDGGVFDPSIMEASLEALGAEEIRQLGALGRRTIEGHLTALKIADDAESCQAIAHKLAGCTGSYGLTALQEAARSIESLLRDGQPEVSPALLDALDDTARQGLESLEDWLASIPA
jgi:CheY-like chemotaxis protein/HPt (histidine-containing phosphotransfer) domain-containing protein